ncbi:hypothetical protein G6F61_014793 [Rhizopus arrhizus]|nr:hypothetical protein G6F23_015491 [Rhizopus arrhizus]KAG1345658.1 hypothetical protein G6F61_014793 [Rhizopus arrhizus]
MAPAGARPSAWAWPRCCWPERSTPASPPVSPAWPTRPRPKAACCVMAAARYAARRGCRSRSPAMAISRPGRRPPTTIRWPQRAPTWRAATRRWPNA